MRFVVRAALALALALLFAALAWTWAIRWHPSTQRYPVQGVDVSAANGPVEWPTVAAAGADFAYAVATRGTAERDPSFEANWSGAAAAGLRRGAIHVWSMCRDGAAQANAFNTTVPRDKAALPPALAIDLDPACPNPPERPALLAQIRRFLAIAEAHAGKPVLLKVSRTAERAYELTGAIDRTVWAIGNGLSPGYAARPWRMWQASDIRRIDGIEGPVNWDVAAP